MAERLGGGYIRGRRVPAFSFCLFPLCGAPLRISGGYSGALYREFSGDNTPAVPPPRCAGTETLNPGAGWPSKEVFGSASSLNTWYSPRSIDYTDSPHYSPYVTVFPDASTNRWWTGSHCADGTCSDTFITYDFGKVSQVCKMAFPNVSAF